jgi:hypothetical protein
MLEQEVTFYEANKASLREKYHGKRVVIARDQVLGVYSSDGEAYEETVKTEPRGTFMIKYIPEDPADEVIWLSPMVQPVPLDQIYAGA